MTMSDLDKLKPYVVDKAILDSASGKVKGLTPEDVLDMMHEKAITFYDKQGELGINFSMDEIVIG